MGSIYVARTDMSTARAPIEGSGEGIIRCKEFGERERDLTEDILFRGSEYITNSFQTDYTKYFLNRCFFFKC